jgi:hypothetical protein
MFSTRRKRDRTGRGIGQEDVFILSIYTFSSKIDKVYEKLITEMMCCEDEMDPQQKTISTRRYPPTRIYQHQMHFSQLGQISVG